MYKKIANLAHSIYQHKALNNDFYTLWMSEKLNYQQLVLFATNYYAHVAPTVDRLTILFVNIQNTHIKKNLIENIADESGLKGKPHSLLLADFLNTLLSEVSDTSVDIAQIQENNITAATQHLVEQGYQLFADNNTYIGCGALLAQEWHAYSQLVKLYEGTRHYMDYFDLETFHEICEYFYIHIGAAEKEHKIQSIAIASEMITNDADFASLQLGFTQYADLLANYWQSLHQQITMISTLSNDYEAALDK